MTDNTVLATKFSTEWVAAYEQKQSFLRGTVTTEGEVKGANSFVFILAGAADVAVERGANGLIPVADDNQASTTCTLREYHHLARKTNFNIYSSSVNQRMMMQAKGIVAINNRTDQMIIDELETTTFNSGGAAANSLGMMLAASQTLDANYVPNDGNRYGLLTPAAWAQAMKIPQWTSRDYVPEPQFMKGATGWKNWNGVKWTMHPNLPNTGLSTAKCYVYHKDAIGHAINTGDMQTVVDQNREQDYSWARVTAYMGAKALQVAGVYQMNHNDTAAL